MTTQLPPPAPAVVYIQKPSRGMAVASISLAIVGCCVGLIPLFGFIAIPAGILAMIFGLIGVRKAKRNGGGKGLPRAGWILGVLAIVLGIAGMVIVNNAINELDNDFDDIDRCYTEDDQAACDRLDDD